MNEIGFCYMRYIHATSGLPDLSHDAEWPCGEMTSWRMWTVTAGGDINVMRSHRDAMRCDVETEDAGFPAEK